MIMIMIIIRHLHGFAQFSHFLLGLNKAAHFVRLKGCT